MKPDWQPRWRSRWQPKTVIGYNSTDFEPIWLKTTFSEKNGVNSQHFRPWHCGFPKYLALYKLYSTFTFVFALDGRNYIKLWYSLYFIPFRIWLKMLIYTVFKKVVQKKPKKNQTSRITSNNISPQTFVHVQNCKSWIGYIHPNKLTTQYYSNGIISLTMSFLTIHITCWW